MLLKGIFIKNERKCQKMSGMSTTTLKSQQNSATFWQICEPSKANRKKRFSDDTCCTTLQILWLVVTIDLLHTWSRFSVVSPPKSLVIVKHMLSKYVWLQHDVMDYIHIYQCSFPSASLPFQSLLANFSDFQLTRFALSFEIASCIFFNHFININIFVPLMGTYLMLAPTDLFQLIKRPVLNFRYH